MTPPVSTHFSHSAFATIDLTDRETITIEEQEFKVIKLRGSTYIEEQNEQRKQKRAHTLSEKIKALPPSVRAEYKRAKKVEAMPEDAALRALRKKLKADKEIKLREELGHKYLCAANKIKHADRLEVSSGEVLRELARLTHLVLTVEGGMDGN